MLPTYPIKSSVTNFSIQSNTVSQTSYFNIGSDWSFSFTVVNGTPRTRSMMWTNPLIAAIFGSTTVALTPPPSTVNVMLLPLLITLKYRFLCSAAVFTWNSWSQQRHSAQWAKHNTQHAIHYYMKTGELCQLFQECFTYRMLLNFTLSSSLFLFLIPLTMAKTKSRTFVY